VRLKLPELTQKLKHTQPGVIWVSGQEALLNDEAASSIATQLKALGFAHERYFAPDFSWDAIQDLCLSQGLFCEKRLIDVDLRQEKIAAPIQTFLLNTANAATGDTVLLLRANERDTPFLKTKWFKSLEAAAWVVVNYRAKFEETVGFCQRTAQQLGLPDFFYRHCADFAKRYQGDLLGLKQALAQLAALDPVQLQTADLREWLESGVSGSLYDWANLVLHRKLDQALPLFATLKETGEEPSLLLWALVRQMKRAYQVSQKTASLQSPAYYALSSEDKSAITFASMHIASADYPKIWAMAAHTDSVIKGVTPGCPYQSLSALSLFVGGATNL